MPETQKRKAIAGRTQFNPAIARDDSSDHSSESSSQIASGNLKPNHSQPEHTHSDNIEKDRLAIFHQHRRRLLAIAYRMLGSMSDAEDMLQETFIRWQQSAETEIESPEAFLVTIISRLCLNYLQSARVKREEYFGSWLPEPVVTGGAGDPAAVVQTEDSVSMAFLVMLEHLTPLERATFLLREVFEYEYSEIARMLEQSVANCRQLFLRARQHLQEQPRFDALPKQQEELLHEFLQASARGDMDGLLTLFSKDIVLYADGGGKTTAVPNPVYGAKNIVRFLMGARRKLLPQGLVRQNAQINGSPGIITLLDGKVYSVLSLGVAEGRIRNIFIVSNPDKLAHVLARG